MVKFKHGYDLNKFKEYYRDVVGETGDTELRLVTQDPDHLIVWLEGDRIAGHAIWHLSDTAVHPSGEPRDVEDRRILEKGLGTKGDFVELRGLAQGE